MAEVVKLSRHRKSKQRQEKAAKAAENRVVFGRTKSEKLTVRQRQEQDDRRHEGHRLTPQTPAPAQARDEE